MHWDEKYSSEGYAPIVLPVLHLRSPPTRICSRNRDTGSTSRADAVWRLSGSQRRGLTVHGVDVSPVAVQFARDLAERSGVGDRCRFDVMDLDVGLPDGPPGDVIVCHLFRDARLDQAVIERLAPGGLLAMAVLSEVDHGPGTLSCGTR